jgi:DNA-binding YbaB/EbfC family protein
MSNQPNMNDLLKQAQQMSQQLMAAQQAAAEEVVEGTSGGGAVKIAITGGMEVQSVKIDPSVVDPTDVEMLEDLVLAAIHDAMNKAAAISQSAMGGLDLGNLGGGLGGLLGQ